MNRNVLQNIRLNINVKFLLILIFLYPFIFIWQGGDLTDTGFFALNYQYFFENLKLGEINSISFLSDFIGAIWFKLFPELGVIGLKFLYLIFFYFIIFFSYLILKDTTKRKNLLLFGIFCAIAFSERWTMFVFSRDIASWLFLVVSSYLLIKGLDRGKLLFIYFGGVFFALACLSRFPNIVFIALLPSLLFYIIYYQQRKITFKCFSLFVKRNLVFVIGFISFLLLFFGVLRNFNLAEIFLSDLNRIGTQNESSYSTLNLLNKYIKEFVFFIPHAVTVASLMLTAALMFSYSKSKENFGSFVIYLILVCLAAILTYRGFSYSSEIKYLVPAFCLIPLLFSLIKKDRFSTIGIVMLAMGLAQVAGSNTGLFLKLSNGFIVLFPLAILIFAEQKRISFGKISLNIRPVIGVGVSIILFLSILTRIAYIYHVDSGLGCRLRAIYPIKHNLMGGIFTTQENAVHIEKLSNAIESNIKPENTLFIYGHQPMFYFLTNHEPPVEKFWLSNNFVSVDKLFDSLYESITATGKWPMIVDTKQTSMGEIGEKKLTEFLRNNDYIIVKENERFSIWNKMSNNI